MRLSLLMFSMAFASCSRVERPSEVPAEAKAQIQSWVEIGTSAADARRIMEQHGFTCTPVTKGSFGGHRGIDFIYCDRNEGGIIQRRWQAALILTKGKVSAVELTIGLVGP